MTDINQLLPEAELNERAYLAGILRDLPEEKLRSFAAVYRSHRRDTKVILLLTILGFLGLAGVQRFMLDQIGMGLLYLFTGGLCLIGTIVDLVNYKRLTFEYNARKAQEIMATLA